MSNYQDTCPYCDSFDLVITETDVENEIQVYCRNCYEEWIEIV